MAKFDFQLRGGQLAGLIVLWALATAGLFLVGALVGYRSVEADGIQQAPPEPEDQAGGSARLRPASAPERSAELESGVPPEPAEDTLDTIYRRRTEVPGTPFGREIYRAASEHELNPALVAAVVWVESGFDPVAISEKGAIGLMQVMPNTAERFGYEPASLTDPVSNLAAGSRYLRWLDQRYSGNLALVLGSYNAGEGAVESYGGIPPYSETREYVRKVMAAFRSLDREPTALARVD